MSEMTLNPTAWKTSKWAHEKGLFSEIFESIDELDIRVEEYTKELSLYNEEALYEMKKVLWEGTDNWDTLLYERAEISGKLVLSDFSISSSTLFLTIVFPTKAKSILAPMGK